MSWHIVALKKTDQRDKKLAIEYGYTDNRKHIHNIVGVTIGRHYRCRGNGINA